MISKPREQHYFYAELAKLLEAGFDIRKAADVMLGTSLPTWQGKLLAGMIVDLDAGKSIADAFAADESRVSELERSIISAGERGGRLAQSFRHLADYFGLLASLRAEAIRSMIYPLFVLHLGIFVAVIPRQLMAGNLSLVDLLMSLVTVLLAVYAGVALLLWLGKLLLDAAPRHLGIDRWIRRIPLVGNARRSMALARFAKVYHTCVLAGMAPSETLEIAGRASHGAVLRKATEPLAAAAREGEQVGPKMIAGGAFPGAFSRSYATAEESGSLDKDMGRWAALFQEEAEAAARAVSATVPKVLYFLILAFVVWQILSFFTGYYETLENLGEDY